MADAASDSEEVPPKTPHLPVRRHRTRPRARVRSGASDDELVDHVRSIWSRRTYDRWTPDAGQGVSCRLSSSPARRQQQPTGSCAATDTLPRQLCCTSADSTTRARRPLSSMSWRAARVVAVEANPVAQTATVTFDPAATLVEDLSRWVDECCYHCAGQSVRARSATRSSMSTTPPRCRGSAAGRRDARAGARRPCRHVDGFDGA